MKIVAKQLSVSEQLARAIINTYMHTVALPDIHYVYSIIVDSAFIAA